MKCAVHPDAEATAYCRNCGKALCPECARSVQGMFYCEPCLAASVAQPAAPPRRQHIPAVAFFLGIVPGLGAVYNGEYTKALIHVAIFVGLVSADSTGMHQPLFGLLTGFFCLYMPIEACVTATNLRHAQAAAAPRETAAPRASSSAPTQALAFAPSSAPAPAAAASAASASIPETPAQPAAPPERHPHIIGPAILIFIGVIFLADNLGWLDADRAIAHGWPLILIAIGLYKVMERRR